MKRLLRLLAVLSAFASVPALADELVIAGKHGRHVLHVDVADTPESRARGLMHRTTLPDDYGMLFLFGEPRQVTMWMKDTPHPLDMIFVGADGKVAGIARRAEPYALTRIFSPGPVAAVIEVAAGVAETLKVAPGDRILHPRIAKE